MSPTYRTDYEISKERVSATGEAEVILGLFHVSEGKFCLWDENPARTSLDGVSGALSATRRCIDDAKSAAVFNAVSGRNADLLLGATFEYTVYNSLFYTSVKCTVKGYPATVKGLKFLDKPVVLEQGQWVGYVAHDENPQPPAGVPCKKCGGCR